MNRFDVLRSILDKRCFFKIVCGAGNEDPDIVRNLTLVYALAGANCMDISANIEVVKSTVSGLDKAERLAPRLGKKITIRPFINVSVGIKGDPHVRKARILSEKCTNCGICIEVCEQKVITNSFNVNEINCIGCGNCADICKFDAIEFYDRRADIGTLLPECILNGAEMIELHAAVADDDMVISDWKLINSLISDNYISMCLDRHFLSNVHLIDRIREAYNIAGERLMIQADGIPMSGGSDDYNTTLQAIAIADVVHKSGIPCMLLASGGTNSKTRELARLCGVDIHGVSIGTFARKLVQHQINQKDFEDNIDLIKQAVNIAEQLVKVNVEV